MPAPLSRATPHPHPGADALELAQVGLFRAVVAKGACRTGEDAVRIRLCGELSQGIVCRPRAVAVADLAAAHADGTDFAAGLGITKWVPPVPTSMPGDAEPAPDLLPWVDIENLRR